MCAILDPSRATLICAAAGHPGPILVRSGGVAEAIEIPGPLVGLFAEERFDQVQIDLAAGDRVVFYSDGVTEALDRDQRVYGLERLTTHLVNQSSLTGCLAAALADVKNHSAGGTEDDLSLLALEVMRR